MGTEPNSMSEIGLGALSGLMLNLGLLKISLGSVFLYLAPAGSSNPAGQS